MIPLDPGPYCNEEGDWWVPVESLGYIAARQLVKADMYDAANLLVYVGREMTWLDTEHESGCGDDCPSRHHVPAWHFREDER